MLRNYFKIAVRSLLKNKSYVIINTLGMGTAIACCIIAYLNYDYSDKFDTHHENYQQIFSVESVENRNGSNQPYAIAPLQFTEMVREQVAGVESVVRTIPGFASIKIGTEVFPSNVMYVDPEFFEVFTIPIVKGDPTAIYETQQIFITAEAAEKVFGDEDPLGKRIDHIIRDEPRSYTVAGVIEKFPPNSSFGFVETIISIENYKYVEQGVEDRPWNFWSPTFIKVTDPDKVSDIEAQFSSIVTAQNEAREDFQLTRFDLTPLKGLAFRNQNAEIWNTWLRSGIPQAAIIGPTIMALMLMLLACFNYTNTSIAMSGRRLKEIGLRKVMGGIRRQLIAQFIVENLVMCLIALILGVVIAELLIPYYNEMWEFVTLEINYTENLGFIVFLVVLLLGVGLVAGSYPSIFLSRFEATPILRGTVKFGGNTVTSKVLLALQLSISLMALISAFAFLNNARYQRDFDLGFNMDEVIYTFVDNGDEYKRMANELARYDEIQEIAGSEHQLMRSRTDTNFFEEDEEYSVPTYFVGHNYLDIMDIELVEGRMFSEGSQMDMDQSVIVNELFLEEYNISDPLDHSLYVNDSVTLFIVGVVKDSYTNALWGPVDPSIFRLAEEDDYLRVFIKADTEDLKLAHEHLGEAYSSLFPNRIYNGVYVNEDLAESAMINSNIIKMFIFLGTVALLLSITGLYAMISLNLLRRVKEIGVRKVLGASVGSIVVKLNRPFLIIVLVALIIGTAGAYFMVDTLLAMIWFHYAPPGVSAIITACLLLFSIAIITVTTRVYRAATVNPVKSLRSE